jgi:sulfonate dioxygenase
VLIDWSLTAHYDPLEKVEPVGRFEHDEPGLRADPKLPNLLKSATKLFELSPHCGTEIQGVQIVSDTSNSSGFANQGQMLNTTLARPVPTIQSRPRRASLPVRRPRVLGLSRPRLHRYRIRETEGDRLPLRTSTQAWLDAASQERAGGVCNCLRLARVRGSHSTMCPDFVPNFHRSDLRIRKSWARMSPIQFHVDQSPEAQPPGATFFCMLESPPGAGGDTIISSVSSLSSGPVFYASEI